MQKPSGGREKTRRLLDVTSAGDSEDQEVSLTKDQSGTHWESQFADPQGSVVSQPVTSQYSYVVCDQPT